MSTWLQNETESYEDINNVIGGQYMRWSEVQTGIVELGYLEGNPAVIQSKINVNTHHILYCCEEMSYWQKVEIDLKPE